MKIYTKTGDTGTTGLFGGERVLKHHPRIEACGTIDELNAQLGYVLAQLHNSGTDTKFCVSILTTIQHDLFTIGSHLATRVVGKDLDLSLPSLRLDGITWQENIIDQITLELSELHVFILPGGSLVGSTCHVARTICRRAERRVIELSQAEEIDSYSIRYLNRLSDLLFQLARLINQQENHPEQPWQKNLSKNTF